MFHRPFMTQGYTIQALVISRVSPCKSELGMSWHIPNRKHDALLCYESLFAKSLFKQHIDCHLQIQGRAVTIKPHSFNNLHASAPHETSCDSAFVLFTASEGSWNNIPRQLMKRNSISWSWVQYSTRRQEVSPWRSAKLNHGKDGELLSSPNFTPPVTLGIHGWLDIFVTVIVVIYF